MLLEEKTQGLDLLYWIDYVNKFDVGHRLPLYTGQGLVQFYNLDICIPVLVLLFAAVCLVTRVTEIRSKEKVKTE